MSLVKEIQQYNENDFPINRTLDFSRKIIERINEKKNYKTMFTLPKNKTSKIPKNYFVFDIESYNYDVAFYNHGMRRLESREMLTYKVAVIYKIKNNELLDKQICNEREDVFNFLLKYAEKSQNLIFAHNSYVDVFISNLIKQFTNANYYITTFIYEKNFILTFKEEFKTTVTKSFVFIDTLNYFKTSLEKLGEMLGYKKLKIDFKKCSLDELIIYCDRDVEILYRTLEKYFQFLKDNNCGNFAFTLAKQSLNAFRHSYLEHDIIIHKDLEAIELERKAYFGGMNLVTQLGIIENVSIYDANSMYPYIMLNSLIPTKLMYHSKKNQLELIKKYIQDGYVICAEVELKTDTPYYPKRIQDKLCFPIGNFVTALIGKELERAINNNHVVNVLQYNVYEAHHIFSKFVTHFYGERMKFENEDNFIFAYMCKIFLNSLYGKFAQRRFYTSIRKNDIEEYTQNFEITDRFNPRVIISKRYYSVEYDILTYTLTKITRIFDEKGNEIIENANFSFVAISSTITANAREYLKNSMSKIDGKIYYIDTDSFMIKSDIKHNLDIGEGLGEWKIESNKETKEKYEHMTADIRGLKHYSLKGKTFEINKLKGVNLKTAIDMCETKTEIIFRCERWLKPTSLMKHGIVDYVMIDKNFIKIIKKYEYSKGIVNEDYSIIPFTFHNNKMIEVTEK